MDQRSARSSASSSWSSSSRRARRALRPPRLRRRRPGAGAGDHHEPVTAAPLRPPPRRARPRPREREVPRRRPAPRPSRCRPRRPSASPRSRRIGRAPRASLRATAARPTRRRGGARARAGRGAANAAATSSASCASRPLATSTRGGSPAKPAAATCSSSGRRRFATTVGAAGGGAVAQQVVVARLARRRRWRRRCRASPRRDSCSWSRPRTGCQPSLRAAIASTPEPQPRSSERAGGRPSSSSASRHSRVVSCAPVPNACAGSIDDVEQAGVARGASAPRRAHVQPLADRHRPVEAAPALGPVVGDLGRRDLDERGAGGGAQRGQRGQLARRAVDGVLDRVAAVDLLDARRRELEQLGERDLRVGARDAHARAGSRDVRYTRERALELREHRLVGLEVRVGHRRRRAARAACAAAR